MVLVPTIIVLFGFIVWAWQHPWTAGQRAVEDIRNNAQSAMIGEYPSDNQLEDKMHKACATLDNYGIVGSLRGLVNAVQDQYPDINVQAPMWYAGNQNGIHYIRAQMAMHDGALVIKDAIKAYCPEHSIDLPALRRWLSIKVAG